ncbi:MerR family transcriptional regulator [Flavisolibacter nicotianae]|uniref:MerR family transcriptional regulator n=1 Tax=Flavisolibacter nicotianae TaxID=2364882 RepID=UPI000EB36DC8|nr:MerR family transcriptional regulator [Flavisolibacter nicotianae]
MTFVDNQGIRSNASVMEFGINDLERLSGIKAHTIRTWEQRYGIPKPAYRNGRTRIYNLDDLKLLLDIAILNSNGYKISTLANLSKEEIAQRIKVLNTDEDLYRKVINELFKVMYQLEPRDFESIIDQCFITWPCQIVMEEIVVPFLRKADLFWQGRQLTEEHLVVTVLRKKILSAIEKIEVPLKESRKILLFLSGSKQLDLALLYATFYIRHKGIEVIYMGNDVSLDNLSTILDTIKPDFLYTYFPRKSSFPFDKVACVINQKSPGTDMVVTIHPEQEIKLTSFDKISFMQLDEALPFLCQ